jgi:membrane-bound ClpP family serine protease
MIDSASTATLALTQTVAAFTFFMPRLTEVRAASAADPSVLATIHTAEVGGLVVCLGVGAICSSLSKSSAPLIVSGFMALVIIALYETVLRQEPVTTKGN